MIFKIKKNKSIIYKYRYINYKSKKNKYNMNMI